MGNVPDRICPVIMPGSDTIPMVSILFIVGKMALSNASLTTSCVAAAGVAPSMSAVSYTHLAAEQLYDYLQTGNIRNSVNLPACQLPPYEGGRLTMIHNNMPNMVSQITSVLAKENVNIAHMNNRSRGAVAYTMIDVDQHVSEQTVQAIRAIEGMIRVRVIKSAY